MGSQPKFISIKLRLRTSHSSLMPIAFVLALWRKRLRLFGDILFQLSVARSATGSGLVTWRPLAVNSTYRRCLVLTAECTIWNEAKFANGCTKLHGSLKPVMTKSVLCAYEVIRMTKFWFHSLWLCMDKNPSRNSGDIMNSLLAGPAGLELDVFKGHALLRNPKGHPRHNPWYKLEEMRPKLVHFLGSDINDHPYRREEMRLELVFSKGWPRWLATLRAKLFFSVPWLMRSKCKDLLRPTYHFFFGPRTVRSSR